MSGARLSNSFFFFSSRRRHTRFSRDWSSDVCSSDLFLGTARFSELVHHRSEQHRGNSEVMRRSLREAEFPTDCLKRRRILVIAIHVTEQAAQFLEGGSRPPCFSRLSLALALTWSRFQPVLATPMTGT